MNCDILIRYQQAEELMQGILTNKIVMNDTVFPHWIDQGRLFWYQKQVCEGKEFRLVDIENETNELLFDHEMLAQVLSQAVQESISSKNLPIKQIRAEAFPMKIRFKAFGKFWLFNPVNQVLSEEENYNTGLLCSPCGKKSIFIRQYDVWVIDSETGVERRLTQDGDADNRYACTPRVLLEGGDIQALWSPDSRRIVTIRLDVRNIADRPLIQYASNDGSCHSEVIHTKLAYPGDEDVESYSLVSIDIETGELIVADYDPLPLWSLGDGFFTEERLGWWSYDSRRVFFVDVKRGANEVNVVEFDTHIGDTRILFSEKSETLVKLSHSMADFPIFYPLPESDELIWFSERSGWGHLYFYDLVEGNFKHSITEGQWLVRDILHYDIARREILIQTAARIDDVSPYYRDICKVNVDTGELTTLLSGNFDYVVYKSLSHAARVCRLFELDSDSIEGVSPDGQYIVTTYSRVDTVPVSVLINRDGKNVMVLEEADINGLPSGWQWPEPIKLKGADGKTDIFGVLYRPPGFSPNESYPILDFSGGTRSQASVPHGSFRNGPCYEYTYLLGAALAALGFIVVAIEGRGTPFRNKAFQTHNYGDVSSSGDFADRVAGIKYLAELYPYMDIERVGLTATDNLAAPVYGILSYPEFYKVAVMHCFHEPRYTFASIGEQYEGISPDIEKKAYCKNSAENNAKRLQGKLLLVQGMLDFATPSGTFRLINALQEENKDFDMLCLPNTGHDVPSYALRRNWDYLVRYLQRVEPPLEFQLTTGVDLVMRQCGS